MAEYPSDLIELPGRFGCWRLVENGRKRPYAARTGLPASTTRLADWCDYDLAAEALRRNAGKYSGLAFLFVRGDGLVGIDLDDCLDGQGNLKPWASQLLYRFADTYSEISPSGNGIKIWARGELPANLPGVAIKGGGSVEMYSWGRYFTMTGRAFRGAPLSVENHASDVLNLYRHLIADKQPRTWPMQPQQSGKIPYGQIHNTLVSICGTLRARRICAEAIEACLFKIAECQAEKPVSVEHIKQIVRSTQSWAAK
jgi:putative DNA primase/helicase